MRAFSIHIGPQLSPARVRCVEHNKTLIDLTMIGLEYDTEVRRTGIKADTPESYSEVLRLVLLSREANLLYLDTDCLLTSAPDFSGIGRGKKSNWAMYSGNNPAIFKNMLDDMTARGKVCAGLDERHLIKAKASIIDAIHKWEIPWFKE